MGVTDSVVEAELSALRPTRCKTLVVERQLASPETVGPRTRRSAPGVVQTIPRGPCRPLARRRASELEFTALTRNRDHDDYLPRPKHRFLIASAVVLAAGIAAPIASVENSSGFGSEVTGVAPATATTIERSLPNGKTDVIKVMGNYGKLPVKQFRGRYQLKLTEANPALS